MVVAQMLRLGQVTGLRVRLSEPNPDNECRILLYSSAQQAPVYVSGILKAASSLVTCDDLDFEHLPPHIARSSLIFLRVMIKNVKNGANEEQWSVALDRTLNLKNMVHGQPAPIAIQVEGSQLFVQDSSIKRRTSSHHSLAAAALRQTIGKRAQGPVVTPSFDVLNKIMTLQAAIDDARMATRTAKRQIDELVVDGYTALEARKSSLEATNRKTKEMIKWTNSKIVEKKAETSTLVANSTTTSNQLVKSLESLKSSPSDPPPDLEKKILAQQARIANVLLEIFPIEIPSDPREQLTICGLPLPSMILINHFDPVQVGAALGLVAQLVIILSRYLDVHLPYPIQPLGSQSYITNPLIHIKGSNIFPLWTNGTLLYRLEYGLYLLRQDIQLLLSSRQVAIVSPFQVLANLKNLMLVISN